MSDLTTPPKIAFGMEGLNGATPPIVKNIYRAIMFLCGFWAIVLEPQFHLPDTITHNIDKWLMVSNTGIYFICQFFGWRQPNQS